MKIQVISIFPSMFDIINNFGVLSKARDKGLWDISIINPRIYANNSKGYIDDRPFGGGPGMVMMPGPMCEAVKQAKKSYQDFNVVDIPIIYLSTKGEVLTHKLAFELSLKRGMILLCGRYEGIDERILEINNAKEVSVGDYVLSGGELSAMVLIDSVVRLIPKVLGNEESIINDSFVNGFLSYPQYTRPYEYEGLKVPDVLLSGNHVKIEKYRLYESLKKTYKVRPDLLEKNTLSLHEANILEEIKKSTNNYNN